MKKIILGIFMVFLAIGLVHAFGQTAGTLDYGEMYVGENKTLTYALLNPNEKEISFEMVYPEELIVEPVNGTINAKGRQEIKVTVFANETGNFSGQVRARLIRESEQTGDIILNLEMAKNYMYSVVPEEESSSNVILYISLAIISFLSIAILIYYIKLKSNGGKLRWNYGRYLA